MLNGNFRKLYLFILLSFTPIIVASNDLSKDIITEGFGQGKGEIGALIAAKRNAIEKAINSELKSQIEIKLFKKNTEKAVTKSLEALKKYDVLSKIKKPAETFEITIKAVISRNFLRKSLSTLHITIESMEKPTAMVIVTESNIDFNFVSSNSAEDAIITFLKNNYDFEIIDPLIVSSIKESTEKMNIISKNIRSASSIGSMHGAEIIIVGYTTSTPNKEASRKPGSSQFIQADVELNVINCTTGKTVASGKASEMKAHISPKVAGAEAISIACTKILKKNITHILEDWNKQIITGVPLTVTIQRVITARVKNVVIRTVKGIPRVISISEIEWNDETAFLMLEVNYKGNVIDFCTKSNGYKMISGGGSFALAGQSGTQVSLVLQSK